MALANGIDKGLMTLVDEKRQYELMGHLNAFEAEKSSGGSASYFGGKSFYSCKVSNDERYR